MPDPRSAPAAARHGRRRVVVALQAGLLSGCGAIEFYWQGALGQLDLVTRARPIAEVLETTADESLRERLRRLQAIRAFASRELALPDNGSYARYTDVGRAFVVWNVFAAPPLSLVPRQWCFPVAGCVAYRGYFAEADARSEAARLAATGDDVHVSGVPAYSTLGWFDDPALSTFIRWREIDLARLVFHELAHQVVYVKDDSAFNESFATAVEEEGLKRWLAAQSVRGDAPALASDAARSRALRAEFRVLIAAAKQRLGEVYGAPLADAQKHREKDAAFAALRRDYEALRQRWGGLPAFDRWFVNGANNAGLAAASLYSDRVPAFAALLAQQDGDLARFYARVRELAGRPRAERDAALAGVAALDATRSGRDNAAVSPAEADQR